MGLFDQSAVQYASARFGPEKKRLVLMFGFHSISTKKIQVEGYPGFRAPWGREIGIITIHIIKLIMGNAIFDRGQVILKTWYTYVGQIERKSITDSTSLQRI